MIRTSLFGQSYRDWSPFVTRALADAMSEVPARRAFGVSLLEAICLSPKYGKSDRKQASVVLRALRQATDRPKRAMD